jgi:UDPglucose 6-dehydrogenase
VDNVRTGEIMKELYDPFVRTGKPILVMDNASAEMTKYAANSMLATKISFMNEVANLCERVGADVEMVRKGIGTDSRIGFPFIFPGVGYGGSCFPKDIKALIQTGAENEVPMPLLNSVDTVNNNQKFVLIPKILKHFSNDIKGKTIAVWGLAFKPKTDDMREAPSINIIQELLKHGAIVKSYDPVAQEQARNIFGDTIVYCKKNYDCLDQADALVLVTEWDEFRRPDWDKMKELMKSTVIFDGRNIFDPVRIRDKGFTYYSIGRP